jgi:P27 family predicted phage terminase small subunit
VRGFFKLRGVLPWASAVRLPSRRPSSSCAAAGGPRPRTHEPNPPKGRPRCPAHLTGPQKLVWRAVVCALAALGVLSKTDAFPLERYVVMLCRWRECQAFIAANGLTYAVRSHAPANYVGRPPDGSAAVVDFREYPQVRIAARLDDALRKTEDRFGLTPAARARLVAEVEDRPRGVSAFARKRGESA